MASGITYVRQQKTPSLSLPFRVLGYRLSVGFWFRRTKDTVNKPREDTDPDLDQYHYSPLPGERHIRVLELHPGAGSEPLCGTLSDVSLDDSAADFEALSYVWGQGFKNHGRVDLGHGQCLRLLPNLEDILYNLRHKTSPRRLWIDALCINQDDNSEKGPQVMLMAEIYARSTSIIIWLGMPGKHSQLGLEILSFLATSDTRNGSDAAPWDHLPSRQVVAALQDILGRQYFERLWVVQEAALATHIKMHVGRMHIEWSSRAQTRKFLARIKMAELSPSWQQSEELRRVDFPPMRELLEQSLAAEARRNGTVEVPSLLDVVHSIRHRQVTDRRDRIYGVMSLVTPAEVAGFVPDYSLTWEETYRRFYDWVETQVLRDPEITVEEMKEADEGKDTSNEKRSTAQFPK
ncbi:Heterokaryon incompatibility protein 6 [Diaporthe amygdali]|uniref:Heterokaryon incompatibility protein 6 n=1 Tax=Phomopsis amygdali TaxID=1214568 RepID=UPI0022FF0CA2|nr:Heterokaryon incompatibility protein 6 [Diaporthe amygdali]KAJ0123674.1 Heterokaryon incompatibility protein 6 [Diaporthe amygdali]